MAADVTTNQLLLKKFGGQRQHGGTVETEWREINHSV